MFKPKFQISPQTAKALMDIEAAKQGVNGLSLNNKARAKLQETAKLHSTHYSTRIEGNRLTLEEAKKVVKNNQHIPGRDRDEQEVLGYYNALDQIELWVKRSLKVKEEHIQKLHALIMSKKKNNIKPTPYRDGQNVIRDSKSGVIVYLPPEAKDVPTLMADLVIWIEENKNILPCPVRAAIAHYQIATIHPYYDGNGRTARLFATLILHSGDYDLNGFYSLEEYYELNLPDYYKALTVGPSHNYYMGRVEADISKWIEYFCLGMAGAFKNVYREAQLEKPSKNRNAELRKLDSRQRKMLTLFHKKEVITAQDIAKLFGLKERTARLLCQKWVASDFIVMVDPAKKSRKYKLHETHVGLIN